ncbi:MAG: hypothetical protein KA419_19920 [Acidobacteria bacterium]|nr:hypothetical protein [Acidobacteriota bacterium]
MILPRFSPDGARIVLGRTESKVFAIRLWVYDLARQTFSRLLKLRPVLSTEEFWWDAAPDGRSFVMIQDVKPPPTRFRVTLNWFEELRRKVPVK